MDGAVTVEEVRKGTRAGDVPVTECVAIDKQSVRGVVAQMVDMLQS